MGTGKRGMIWENGIETCIFSYTKLIASPGLIIHDTVGSGLVHCDDLEGWYGSRWEGGSGWGTHVLPWQIHISIWQNQYNIVKQLASN